MLWVRLEAAADVDAASSVGYGVSPDGLAACGGQSECVSVQCGDAGSSGLVASGATSLFHTCEEYSSTGPTPYWIRAQGVDAMIYCMERQVAPDARSTYSRLTTIDMFGTSGMGQLSPAGRLR